MSMSVLVQGTFKNGKKRNVGIHSPKGMEFKNQFDSEDILFLSRVLESGSKCFNWNIENDKFKKVDIIFHGSYCNNKGENIKSININLKKFLHKKTRIDPKSIIDIINNRIRFCS